MIPKIASDKETRLATQQFFGASFKILLPFVIALSISAVIRISASEQAIKELSEDARKFTQKAAENPALSTAEVVTLMSDDVFGKAPRTTERQAYEQTFLTVAHRLQALKDQPNALAAFDTETEETVYPNAFAVASIQSLAVLFFPALFIAMLARARSEIRRTGMEDRRPPDFAQLVAYNRHRRFLTEEGRWLFWRRLAFALLITTCTAYLTAPVGLKTTIMEEYITTLSLPGQLSLPAWLQAFTRTQPFVIGFAGFFLYSPTAFVERYTAGDLSHRMLVSLFNRGLTVTLLGVAISAVLPGENLSKALIFAVGVFPSAGLQAISKVTQTNLEKISDEEGAGFEDVPEINVWKETSLDELGIEGVHDLAKADLRSLIESVGINAKLLLRAADRSLAVNTFGSERCKALSAVPLHTASELVLYALGSESYAARWQNQEIPCPFVGKLDQAEKTRRA